MVMSALKAKLMPTRFDGMSPLMAAIVGHVLGKRIPRRKLRKSPWGKVIIWSISARLGPLVSMEFRVWKTFEIIGTGCLMLPV